MWVYACVCTRVCVCVLIVFVMKRVSVCVCVFFGTSRSRRFCVNFTAMLVLSSSLGSVVRDRECSTKCAMLVRWSRAACHDRRGRLTVQKKSGTCRAPSIRWKTPAFRGKPLRRRTLQLSNSKQGTDPPKSGSSSLSALARILDPRQSGTRSCAATQLLLPSGVTAAIAERCMPLQLRKGVCSSPGVAMNDNEERPSSLRWPPSVARKSGSCSNPSSSLGGNFDEKSSTGVVSGVVRDASLNKRKDSTTECKAGKCFSWARAVWKYPKKCLRMLSSNSSRCGAYIGQQLIAQVRRIGGLGPMISQEHRW